MTGTRCRGEVGSGESGEGWFSATYTDSMAKKPAISRTYETQVLSDPDGSSMTAIAVPFDAKEVFGKARAPVVVRVGGKSKTGHEFRSTVCVMGGERFIPLRGSNREASGVVTVTLTLDDKPRVVKPPVDLARALREAGTGAVDAWKAMSFTHQREHVEAIEQAKKPETRERRVRACVEMVLSKSAALDRKARPVRKARSKA
jgi:hypothetical protein